MEEQILIIDSNTYSLKKLREILTKAGYNIMTVTNFESALSICSKIKIDYIIINQKDFEKQNQTEEKWKK